MHEMYAIEALQASEIKNQWDILRPSPRCPAPNEDLEAIAPTKEENACTFATDGHRRRAPDLQGARRVAPPSASPAMRYGGSVACQTVRSLAAASAQRPAGRPYYLLIALGLSLIFSLGGIVNLAHGAFYAIGAYLTVVLSPTIGFGGSLSRSPVLVACWAR